MKQCVSQCSLIMVKQLAVVTGQRIMYGAAHKLPILPNCIPVHTRVNPWWQC
jgi:hypothetical protein